MSSTTANNVTDHLTELSALKGTLLEVFTNSRQPFNSKVWCAFTNKYGFKYTTSNPCYPKCNSFNEGNVHTIKCAFNQIKAFKIPVPQALMKLRQTPIDPNLPSLMISCTTNQQYHTSLASNIHLL